MYNKSILKVSINDKEICVVRRNELPFEITPEIYIQEKGALLTFVNIEGKTYYHKLSYEKGWFGFSIRVHKTFVCEVDCIYGSDKSLITGKINYSQVNGIRFQPFYMAECKANSADLVGKSLFYRGLHFSGNVTPGNLSLSCICDSCSRSFRIQSFHAGFTGCGYFYSESSKYTLIIPDHIKGCPPALGKPNIKELLELESSLPNAPDGTKFTYYNSFNCPYCGVAYIDFKKFPEMRSGEYYGNIIFHESPLHYEDFIS